MTTPRDAPTPLHRFYLAAWRWHFYAGVAVLPFIVILAVSGLAMLAAEPLDRHLHREFHTVAPDGARLSAAAQAAAALGAYPQMELATLRVSRSPDEATRIDVVPRSATPGHSDADTLTVFVDPYKGVVLGALAADATIYAWAKKLHGTLLLGTTGDYVIEIVAGLGVLLLASGLYLWWPRDDRPLRQRLLPSVAGPGRRRWRDLHGAVGVWIAPPLAFFLVSGLAWTPFWGAELVQSWSSLPGETFTAPTSSATHGSLAHGAHHDVPWALEQTPLPASGSMHGVPAIAASGEVDVDDVVAYARAAGFTTFRVHWPRGADGVWTIAATTIGGDTRDPRGDRIVHIDRGTGNVLADIGFADYSPMGKFMAAGIPLHQADTGMLNLALNVVVCVAVLGLCFAALAAWWARRPSGARRLVPPPLPRDMRAWRSAVLIMLALSLAFPLAAATIAVVLALDALLVTRIARLRLWFE